MGLKMGIGIGLNIFVVLLMACFKKFSKIFSPVKKKFIVIIITIITITTIIIIVIIIFKKLSIQWQIYFVYVSCIYYYSIKYMCVCICMKRLIMI